MDIDFSEADGQISSGSGSMEEDNENEKEGNISLFF